MRPEPVSAAQIGFGRVMHARLHPARHRFDYPVYFLRLPVHALPRIGSRWLSLNRFNLLSFHEADHGDGTDCLAWARGLLNRHGLVADGDIWLTTFPRVLGYAFKPVSFWHCHAADGSLVAILAEVNNTFGERHCYLLRGAGLAFGNELRATKVFHVSPFCAIEGDYRFRFMRTADRTVARIDHDDADGPLLQTSLSGALEPLTDRALLRALFGYPAFTLGVIARIHWQALKLFAKRVPFFSKPAPPAHPVTR